MDGIPFEYEVSVHNTFEADSPEDAVLQMVEWLLENAHLTAYRVGVYGYDTYQLIDAERVAHDRG